MIVLYITKNYSLFLLYNSQVHTLCYRAALAIISDVNILAKTTLTKLRISLTAIRYSEIMNQTKLQEGWWIEVKFKHVV